MEKSIRNLLEDSIPNSQTTYLNNLPPVTTSHTNLVLVDQAVSDYKLFVDSCNDSTYPIVYSRIYDADLLLNYITKSFSTISRIAIVCHGQENVTTFLNNESFSSPKCVDFLVTLINKFEIKTIDFLACNTLKYTNWINYYNELKAQTNVTIGASNDLTGNIKYGGDWVLESTGEDIRSVYWTNLIDDYNKLLVIVTINGIKYTLTNDNNNNKIAVVIGPTNKTITEAAIPDKVLYDGTIYSVTSIGNDAFYGCSSLASVTIPVGVTSIGNDAFYGCSSLQRISIPASVTTIVTNVFSSCMSLQSILLKNNDLSTLSQTSLQYVNKSLILYLPNPNVTEYLGYRVVKLTNYIFNNVPIPVSISNYYPLSTLTNQYMQKSKTRYVYGIKRYIEPTAPYVNPIKIYSVSNPFSLSNTKITYIPSTPSGTLYNITKSTGGYTWSSDNQTKCVFDSNNDDYYQINLLNKFTFCTASYDSLYVGTNGYITIDVSNTSNNHTPLENHFKYKQISVFMCDLVVDNTGNNGVCYSYDVDKTVLTITWVNLYLYRNLTKKVNAQVKLYLNTHLTKSGQIEVNYGSVAQIDCLIGLSDGSGKNYPTNNPVSYCAVDFDKLAQ